jgi:transposase
MLFLNRTEEEEMAQKRLSMRKIEEILRLNYEKKLTHRAIAQACAVSSSTVSEYLTHAKAAGLSWPLPEGLSAEELEELLFPKRTPASRRSIPQPDWGKVHRELRRKSVTLSLLWVEYRQTHPDGYGYSQFCHNYNKWAKQLKPMMRQRHWAGEKLFIDYAGPTVPVADAQTGEVSDAEIFVAVLGASNFTYAEAHES